MVVIDYNNNITSRLGIEYEDCLLFNDSGLRFLITNIEKVSASNKFILTLASAHYSEINGIRDIGQIHLEYFDNRFLKISNISRTIGFDYDIQWWKSAGPDIIFMPQYAEEDLHDDAIIYMDLVSSNNTSYEIISDDYKVIVNNLGLEWLWFLLLVIPIVTVIIIIIKKVR